MNESITPTPGPRSGTKRNTTIGVAAGLLAGGAIGLVATVPSLTSAASDDSSDPVVLQDDTDETGGEATDETTDERPEVGERLRETLQDLVDDGTITDAQADAVTSHLVENRPERDARPGRPGRRGVDGHGRNSTVLADILGIDSETLRTELAAGNSVADIAEANGVGVQTVIDALIADAESHIELATEHGLDEDQAAIRLERVAERIEAGVYRTRGTDS